MKKRIVLILVPVLLLALAAPAAAFSCQRSAQSLAVDGRIVACDKYNIDGSNYFKLRDLAQLLNGTGSQFDVGWDGDRQLVSITTNHAYTVPNGTELVVGDDQSATAMLSAQTIMIDGAVRTDLTVYNIGGSNFFKLRELGDALGFAVDYDGATNTAIVESASTVEPIAFDAMLRSVSAARKALIEGEDNYDGFDVFLVEDPTAKDLLTAAEIAQLQDQSGAANQGKQVSYDDAVADVDLFFRTFKNAYGAYYYFGGDAAFDAAKQAVLAALPSGGTVDAEQLGALLRNALQILKDGHCRIQHASVTEQPENKYQFYYCGESFSKDESGYYRMIGGEKWYYAGCAANAAEMAPYLGGDGAIVYSPVVWCPATQLTAADTLTLRCGTKTQTTAIQWTQATPYAINPIHDEICEVLEEQGILYFSMRSFHNQDQTVTQRFVSTADAAKRAKLVIVDLRSNGGGADGAIRDWMSRFTGSGKKELAYPLMFSSRFSQLAHGPNGKTSGYELSLMPGTFWPNDVPVIVLVDNNCGSAGESALNALKTLDNVLVVGGNSGGYQLCGNQMEFTLPNTGMQFSLGYSLQFAFRLENVDGKGYAPDIWCDPAHALDCVLAMLERYDLASDDTVNTLRQRLETETEKRVNLQLKWAQFTVDPNNGFGGGWGTHYIDVLLDGAVITDFEVTSSDESVCTVMKDAQGRIVLNAIGAGDSILTVTARGGHQTFRWHCE